MADFEVLINTPKDSYTLDCIDSFVDSSESQLTEHPVVGGDMIADHMIKMPCTITIRGTFSMQGSTPVSSLASKQKIFEDLKNNGTLCTVAKVKTKTHEFRFLKRSNMVLSGITWTERINSVDFDFTFRQVLLDYSVVMTKASISTLPDIEEPATLSFEGSLISQEALYNEILQALIDSNIVDKAFLEQVAESSIGFAAGAIMTFVGIQAAVAGVGALTSAIAAGGAAAAATGPIGWIVGGVALAAVGVTLGIISIVKAVKEGIAARDLKYKAFKSNLSDYEEQRKENKRFADMMDEIYGEVDKVNQYFKIYSFAEDKSQEVMLNVGGTYHVITINKANGSSGYTCKICDFSNDGENLRATGKIGVVADPMTATFSQAFYTTKTTMPDGNYYGFFFIGDSNDLTRTSLLVASIEPSKFTETLTETIVLAISGDSK